MVMSQHWFMLWLGAVHWQILPKCKHFSFSSWTIKRVGHLFMLLSAYVTFWYTILGSEVNTKSALWILMTCWYNTRARFLSLAQSKLRLCSANHRAGYFSNLACDWLSIVWAYSEQETENGPRTSVVTTLITLPCISSCLWVIIWMMI